MDRPRPPPPPRRLPPKLPLELVQRIIRYALPELSFRTFDERYGTLLSCCRVSRAWWSVAFLELRQHVFLCTKSAAISWMATREYDRPPPTSLWIQLAYLPRQLFSPAVLTNVVQDCPGLVELYMTAVKSGPRPFAKVDLQAMLPHLPHLERLALDGVKLSRRTLQYPLHRLYHLSLHALSDPYDLTPLLKWARVSLPALNALSFTLEGAEEGMHDIALATMYGAVEDLAPKLDSLALLRIERRISSPFDEEAAFWRSFRRFSTS